MEAIKKKKNMNEKEKEKREIYILSLSNVIQCSNIKKSDKKRKWNNPKEIEQ